MSRHSSEGQQGDADGLSMSWCRLCFLARDLTESLSFCLFLLEL